MEVFHVFFNHIKPSFNIELSYRIGGGYYPVNYSTVVWPCLVVHSQLLCFRGLPKWPGRSKAFVELELISMRPDAYFLLYSLNIIVQLVLFYFASMNI